jgi:coiled-coil domain-containing protein 151
MRKYHDDLKTKFTRLCSELDGLIDQVKDLESHQPHMEDNQYTSRIRALENKLDKATIKNNEAQSIRKTCNEAQRKADCKASKGGKN